MQIYCRIGGWRVGKHFIQIRSHKLSHALGIFYCKQRDALLEMDERSQIDKDFQPRNMIQVEC